MTKLVAQVTILRRGADGGLRSVNGSAAYDTWRDPIVVSPGQTFNETDAAEVTRLLASKVARLA